MSPDENSLDEGYQNAETDSSLESATPVQEASVVAVSPGGRNQLRFGKVPLAAAVAALVLIVVIAVVGLILNRQQMKQVNKTDTASQYDGGRLSLDSLEGQDKLTLERADNLAINGRLQVSKTLVITPTDAPSAPIAGQIYYDKTTNAPYFYNGSAFVSLAPTATPQSVTSLGGSAGIIGLGGGLQIDSNQLSIASSVLQDVNNALNAPRVSSLQGLTGTVTLSGGPGITISGTTISNSGVVSLSSGSPNLSVTNDGNGNYTVADTGGGVGNAVSLAPPAAQTDNTTNSSIHVDKTAAGNFLQFAASGVDSFVVDQTGLITVGTINYSQVQGRPATTVTTVGGASGAITLGAGLGIAGNTVSNTGVTALAGTANQINVSGATGSVTLSLPQDIAAGSTPTFGGLTLNGGLTITSGGASITGNINGASISGGSLSATAVNGLNISGTAISGTGVLTVDASGANNVSIGGISTGSVLLAGGFGAAGCTITNINGNLDCNGTINGATISGGSYNGANISGGTLSGGNFSGGTVSGGTLTALAVNNLNVSGTAIAGTGALTIDANGLTTVSIGSISTGNILLGGGNGSTGCTVNNATGDFACDGNINGATITAGSLNGAIITGGTLSGGNFSGGNISGGKLSDTYVNSLNVNLDGSTGTAISSDTSFLTIDAQGGNTISLGSISTGNILLGGGSGATGCTVTNANGSLVCDGTINGSTLSSNALTFGAAASANITAGGSNQNLNLNGSGTGAIMIAGLSTGGVEIGGSGTGDILLGGGLVSTGCTITNASGNLACTGTINGLTLTNGGSDPTIGVPGRTLTIRANASINQDLQTTSNPTFNGLTVASVAPAAGTGLTIGAIGASQTTLVQGNSLSFKSVGGGKTVNFTFGTTTEANGGTYEICDTSGNCAGAGGGITGSGTTNTLPLFNSSNTLTNSIITQDGGATKAIIGGNLDITGTSLTGTGALTVASTGGANALTLTSGSGSLVLGGSTTTVQRTGSALSLDLTAAATSTLTVTNSNGSNVANLNVEGGLNIGASQTYKINNVDINTGGTLSNVAYLNQNNAFTGVGTTSFAGNLTGGTYNSQTISSTANFTGTLAVNGANSLSLGTASTHSGAILFQSQAGAGTVTLRTSTTTNPTSYTLTLPDSIGSANDCLKQTTAGGQLGFVSCAAGLGGSGTPGKIAKFDGLTSIADSLLSESGSVVSIQGSGNSFSVDDTISAGLNGGSGIVGTVNFRDGTNPGRTIGVQAQPVGSSYTLLLPTTADVGSACLVLSNVSAGVNKITGGSCAAGGSGGNVTATGSTNGRLLRFTSDGPSYSAAASLIQDDSSGIGVNIAPQASYLLTIGSSNRFKVTDGGQLEIGTTGSNPLTLATNGNISNVGTLTATGLLQTSASAQAFILSGAPAASTTQSLFQLGGLLGSNGNNVANGGTYIGLNAPAAGAGSAADFLNFQANGVAKLRVDKDGNFLVAGTYNGLTLAQAANQFSINGGTGTARTLTVTGNSTIDQDLSTTSNTVQFGRISGLTTKLEAAQGGTGTDTSGATAGAALLFNATTGKFEANLITSSDASITVTPTDGQLNLTVSSCTTCATTTLNNLGTTSINANLLAQNNVNLGSTSNAFKYLYLYGDGTQGSGSFRLTGTTAANRTLTLPDATGTLCYVDGGGNGNCTGVNGGAGNSNYIFNQTTQQTSANFNIQARSSSVAAVIQGASGQNIANFVASGGGTVASFDASGNLAAGTINGATVTSTAFNGLTVSGTAVTGSGALTIDANGANTLSLGTTSTGDILLGGGSGATGCTVTNTTGNLACAGTMSTGTTGTTTGSIAFRGSTAASGSIILQGQNNPSTNNYTLTIPLLAANDTICTVQVSNCHGVNGGSGNVNYIFNQTTQQTSANFNIQARSSSVAAVIQGASGQNIANFVASGGGTVATIDQNGALTAVGVNSGSGVIQGTGGLTTSGANSSINHNSNFVTNINTGSSTGTVNIGNGAAGAITLQSAGDINLSSAAKVNLSNGSATTANLLVLDASSVAPTAIAGGMYYNGTKFRCSEDGSTFVDCIASANTTIQGAYDNGDSTTAGILTSSGTKNFYIRAGVGFDNANLFKVQNAGGVAIMTVDSSATKLKIGTGTPTLGSGSTGALYVSDTLEVLGQIRFGDATNNVNIDGTTKKVTYNGTARNTKTVQLVPEFVNMTLHADTTNNIGSLTSDYDTTNNHGYYNWSTTQTTGTEHDYDMYVRIPMPRDWAAWNTNSNNTNIVICYNVWADNLTNALVTAQMLDTANSSAGTFTATPTSASTWQEKCSTTQYNSAGTNTFTVNGKTYVTLKIHFEVPQASGATTYNVRIGEITMDYLSSF